ncbi:MAG: substrate-binding domain-containing protein [Oscillospiraceae bacterium]|nr:substrate-binding domain-containing protein [Oscillospiraceae bacterium]
MKKLLALLLAAVMVLGMFAGCGNTAEDPAAPQDPSAPAELDLVGFCTTSMSESIFVLEEEALVKIFEGKAKVQTASCDQDSALQIQQIKNFITMGADLLVINPTDIRALGDAIKEAHEAGVKVYINGATSEELSEEYYDCCTVSDEYLCGAYVAMIAKNWIEAHADELNAANPNWELSFLESNLAEETVKRSLGEQSIIEPYLKNADGDYVDASGNVVDEANKVENPAFCQIALDHFNGIITEQDQANGGLNVANILTTNPNTRVFIAYNSLASTQGGQYIVDNYADQLDEFAFFSAGVMGNEADYIVGSVDADAVGFKSVMRGAVQFGVSAAGGDVATSVANTAYGILYGVEGVDYFKKNPDGIAAWWAVEEDWAADGVASVAHFNILSGATVQPFDPIESLKDENTVYYWNSRDGFIVEEEPEDDAAAPGVAEGDSYVFEENNGFMDITWTLTLGDDGRYTLTEVNQMFPDGASYVGNYTLEGDMAVCAQMEGNAPGQFDWANPAGFTVQLGKGFFAPEGRELPVVNSYVYQENNGFMDITWTLTLVNNGRYTLTEVNQMFPDGASYVGNYTLEGDMAICAQMEGNAPGQFDWANPAGFTVQLGEGVFAPEGRDLPEAPAGIAAGEYTFDETIPTGEVIKWTVTLNEDGSAVVAQPENAAMGNPTWTAVWSDNGDGTFITAECVGSGPQIAGFWKNNSITWIFNGDGTVTPVGY